ncbi:hypothetical protein XA68_15408 [Ophiocordyceps unilateralis]|uniref:Thiamine pyrophosphokinase n=1 Tax=Ophiocordyceps unilateralis TaxID=268505 RepID=A0A2A9P6W2_OPHUN|nr:hypothetical protein XA68_15408 [Ophiocordyceps unilateralis]
MTSRTFEWHPAKLLQERECSPEFALLVLNQPLKNGNDLRRLWNNSSFRVAADGGANRLHDLSSFRGKFSNLQAIVGDLDSLEPSVKEFYCSQPTPTQVIHDPDQESTDFGKAITWIRQKHPEGLDIVALGGLGGRVDQGVSQLHQLYLFHPGSDYSMGRIYLLSGCSLTFLLKAGTHRIQVKEDGESVVFGKHVGIIPLQEPSLISTKGLRWDVCEWETKMGGKLSTSNHVLPEAKFIQVQTSKDVLFTIALRRFDGEDDG